MPVSKPLLGVGFKEALPEPENQLKLEFLCDILTELICGSMTPLYRKLYDENLVGRDFPVKSLSVPGALCTVFGGETSRPEYVRELLLQEIRRLRSEGVDAELFTLCKNQLYGELIADLENIDDVAAGSVQCVQPWPHTRRGNRHAGCHYAGRRERRAAEFAAGRVQCHRDHPPRRGKERGTCFMINHVTFSGAGPSMTINRVAFTVFGVPVYWYGICIALGLVLGLAFRFFQGTQLWH